ncbi:Aste57867_16943 [Aphanomyces stellatus]|uniref:Aste57867_16943 protein n=1 Tax=Aphanomyces stellatus TaxID=120398 RepID=A0A485L9T5_9STRA|nr:hypothetical protein As57867_016885 [Aphanomyces stellatus]VFT93705.1 Aste57867_16943 [Aphanomyces stellatus]
MMMTLVGKWKKEELVLQVAADASVLHVKELLYAKTKVQPHRQKLVGINHQGKPAGNEVLLRDLTLKNPHKFMLIGTVEDDIFVDPDLMPKDALPTVFSDFDCAYSPGSVEWTRACKRKRREPGQICRRHEDQSHESISTWEETLGTRTYPSLMHERDASATKSNDIPMDRFRRPCMHEFLTEVWQHYDIGIWSQTSWKWIEIKLTELGMLTTPDYRINFILDKTSMFSFAGARKTNKVKALQIIWRAFPGTWHAQNTLHVDDLPHNFNLNPRNGIPIVRYDCKEPHAHADRELLYLARYLVDVCATVPDVTELNHAEWSKHRS